MNGPSSSTWPLASNPRLLDNGHLMDSVTNSSGAGGFGELDWNGNVVWSYYESRTSYHPHGDFQRIFDPKLGALRHALPRQQGPDARPVHCRRMRSGATRHTTEPRSMPSWKSTMSGNVDLGVVFLRSRHSERGCDEDQLRVRQDIANYPGRINLNLPGRPLRSNWLDCNSLDYNQSLDQIVVNSRQGEFYIIDHGGTFIAGNPTAASRRRPRARAISSIASAIPPGTPRATPLGQRNWENATNGNKQIGASSNVQWIRAGPAGGGPFAGVQQQPVPLPAHAAILCLRDQPVPEFQRRDTGTYVDPPTAGYSTWTFDKDTQNSQPAALQTGGLEIRLRRQPDAVQPLRLQRPAPAQRQYPDLRHHPGLHGRSNGHGQVAWEYINPVTDSGIVDGHRRLPAHDQCRSTGLSLRATSPASPATT